MILRDLAFPPLADEPLDFLDDASNRFADHSPGIQHANTSDLTANQEMNNGIESDLKQQSEFNETMSVNNNHAVASHRGRVKRE